MSLSGDILGVLDGVTQRGGPFGVKANLRNKFSELSVPRALQPTVPSCPPPTASSSDHLQQE